MKNLLAASALALVMGLPVSAYAQSSTESAVEEECADIVDGEVTTTTPKEGGVPCAPANESELNIQAESDTEIDTSTPKDEAKADPETSEAEVQAEAGAEIDTSTPQDEGEPAVNQ